MSRVVAYVRDSGGAEQDTSTAQQVAEIERACLDRGWKLTRVFRDEARPGSSVVGRESFNSMIRYLHQGDGGETAVVVWKYNRLSRDLNDSQYYKADLRRRGIEIISLTDNIPDGPDGRLIESVVDWMSQRYLIDLATDVKRGQAAVFQAHKAHFGPTPTGYRRVPISAGVRRDGREHVLHRLEPDPETADRVRRAFELRAAGHSYREIERQVRLGKSVSGYKEIFSKTLYMGEVSRYGVVIADYVEPLVDRATWDRVQQIIGEWRDGDRHPRREASTFLLSGLARCAVCGSSMSGSVSNAHKKPKDGTKYRYYRCIRRREEAHPCDAQPVSARKIEDMVLSRVREFMLDPEIIKGLYREYVIAKTEQAARSVDQVQALTKERDRLRARLGRVASAIADYGHSDTLLSELRDLEATVAQVERDIGLLDTPAVVDIPDESIEQFTHRAWSAIETAPLRDKRGLLTDMIAWVSMGRDGGAVTGTMAIKELPVIGPVDIVTPLV